MDAQHPHGGFFGRGQSRRPDHRARGSYASGLATAVATSHRGRFSNGQSDAAGRIGDFAEGIRG